MLIYSGIDHYTQLAWAEIDSVGCARIVFDENELRMVHFVCNYAGKNVISNLRNAHVYKIGEPCSQCPSGLKCNSVKWAGLCGDDENELDKKRSNRQYVPSETRFQQHNYQDKDFANPYKRNFVNIEEATDSKIIFHNDGESHHNVLNNANQQGNPQAFNSKSNVLAPYYLKVLPNAEIHNKVQLPHPDNQEVYHSNPAVVQMPNANQNMDRSGLPRQLYGNSDQNIVDSSKYSHVHIQPNQNVRDSPKLINRNKQLHTNHYKHDESIFSNANPQINNQPHRDSKFGLSSGNLQPNSQVNIDLFKSSNRNLPSNFNPNSDDASKLSNKNRNDASEFHNIKNNVDMSSPLKIFSDVNQPAGFENIKDNSKQNYGNGLPVFPPKIFNKVSKPNPGSQDYGTEKFRNLSPNMILNNGYERSALEAKYPSIDDRLQLKLEQLPEDLFYAYYRNLPNMSLVLGGNKLNSKLLTEPQPVPTQTERVTQVKHPIPRYKNGRVNKEAFGFEAEEDVEQQLYLRQRSLPKSYDDIDTLEQLEDYKGGEFIYNGGSKIILTRRTFI